MLVDGGNTNQSNSNYPPEEWSIARQLVRMIGSAHTWQDMVEASDALFQVQLRAKGLRSERDNQISGQSAQALTSGASQGAANFDRHALQRLRKDANY